MKLEKVWYVMSPGPVSEIEDICGGADPVELARVCVGIGTAHHLASRLNALSLYTTEEEAIGDARSRLAGRDAASTYPAWERRRAQLVDYLRRERPAEAEALRSAVPAGSDGWIRAWSGILLDALASAPRTGAAELKKALVDLIADATDPDITR